MAQLDGLHSVVIDISRDITDLSAQLRALLLSHSTSIETLSQGLTKVAKERDELMNALSSQKDLEEARYQAREQQMR